MNFQQSRPTDRNIALNLLECKEPIPHKILGAIRKHGFITGSKVFGGATEESDIDIVVNANTCPYSFGWLVFEKKYGAYPQDYANERKFESVYVKDASGRIYNILFCSDDDVFDTWQYATRLMREIIEQNDPIRIACLNKNMRIDFFITLRTMITSGKQK